MSKENRPYAKRLRAERIRLNLSQAELAGAGNVSKTTQVAYESNAHVPDMEYLTRIESLGVDKIFLLSGLSKATFVSKEFDWSLLAEIVEALIEWSEENNVQIPPHKFADLLHLLYEQFVETRIIEPAVLARTLRLVA
jgi:transcriptional regulator with XRE-family HTH domain